MEETKYSNYLIADALFNNMMVSVTLLSPAVHFVLAAGQQQPKDKLTLLSAFTLLSEKLKCVLAFQDRKMLVLGCVYLTRKYLPLQHPGY